MAAKKNVAVIPVFTGRNVPLPEIVQASGIGKATIKNGLRDGVLDFGYADCPKTKKILVKRQRMWYN